MTEETRVADAKLPHPAPLLPRPLDIEYEARRELPPEVAGFVHRQTEDGLQDRDSGRGQAAQGHPGPGESLHRHRGRLGDAVDPGERGQPLGMVLLQVADDLLAVGGHQSAPTVRTSAGSRGTSSVVPGATSDSIHALLPRLG